MWIECWIPSLTTTALFTAVIWLGRNWILTRLKASIEFEYQEKVEGVRSEFRQREREFDNRITARDNDLRTLRQSAIASLEHRSGVVDQRRIAAVDQMWSSVIAMRKAKSSLFMMSVVNFDAMSDDVETDPRLQTVISAYGDADLEVFSDTNALSARPFVSEIAWSTFSAYQAVLMQAVAKQHLLQSGIDGRRYVNLKHATKLLKTLLPHHAKYLDEHGDAVHHLLIDEVEALLLAELKRVYMGVGSDEETVHRAAEVLKLSEELMATPHTNESNAVPSA